MTNRTDDFNRADSSTTLGAASDGLGSWTAGSGTTWGIQSNAGYCVTSVSQAVAWLEASASVGTGSVTLGAVGVDFGLVGRLSTSNTYVLGAFTSGTGWRVFENNGGSFTQRGSTVSGSVSSTDTITLQITSAGSNNVVLAQNGTARVTATSSFNSTATKWGIRVHNNTDVRFDSYSFTDAAASGLAANPMRGGGAAANPLGGFL